jgi:hypothetical protein
VVVTEFGPVPVSWRKEIGALKFSVTVPPDISASLALPLDSGRDEITLDGKQARGQIKGSRLTIELHSGSHSGMK